MNYLKKLRMLLVALSLVTPLLTHAANVTIKVLKSDGSPLQGVSHILTAPYATNMGSTDAAGLLSYTVADGTHTFQVSYKGTSKTITAAVSGTQTLTFYTTAVNVTVAGCSPVTPVEGVVVAFQSAYLYDMVGTNASGQSSEQLFPGTYNMTAKYKGTSQTQSVIVTGNGLAAGAVTGVTYNPTRVVLGNAGSKTYVAGYTYSADGTLFMFPGTYQFNFSGGFSTNLTIAGCSQNMTVNKLVLRDHNNNPIMGGAARGGSGTNFSTFFVSGNTDANGVLYDIRNNAGAQMSYEMKLNNTTSVLTQTSNNVYNFKTIELKLKLETCNGTPLSGGGARYGNGAIATTYYFPGANSTNASGELNAEFFPGTYSFEMGINSSTQSKISVVVPNANTTLVWNTTAVTLNWPHAISYGGAGDSRFFNGPTMELLPCTLNFNFRAPGSNNYTPLTISGCNMTLTPGIVRLISSTNAPISGGEVSGYQGGWATYGTTGANGNLLILGSNPNILQMKYVGGNQQLSGINMGITPIVTFQTKAVTMELKDANGNHLEATDLSYYANGWKTFGSGSTIGGIATMELLPLAYTFKLSYGGATQQKANHNVAINQVVSYQTKTVTMELRNSEGILIDGGTNLSYYANGWRTFGSGLTVVGIATMELLPMSYEFNLNYKGATQQISNQNVDANQLVSYQTELVTMELKDAGGNHLDGGTNLSYYANGWKTFGSGSTIGGIATMELLPLAYTFKLSYGGATQQKANHNVAINQVVSYQTQTVTMELRNSEGGLLEGGVNLTYYANGWNVFGTGSAVGGVAAMQLLPSSYTFSLSYKGATQQISDQDVSVNSLVGYQTAPVSVMLRDQNGDPLEGGLASFYAGTWQSMGTTDANGNATTELLPVSYAFKMVYNSKSNQQSNISAPADVDFFYNTSTNLFRYGNTEEEPNIKATNNVLAMELYPNPVSDKLNIRFYSESEKTATVKVLDLTGKVIVSESFVTTEGSNTHVIDLSHLSAGAYFVMFNNADVEAKRIVVQH